MNHLKTHQTNLMVPWDPIDAPLGPLNDDTKNLTETDTETFFPIPNFPKPIPRLFFRYQIFRNRNRYPQKIGKSFETEKFRNRNVNLCLSQQRSYDGSDHTRALIRVMDPITAGRWMMPYPIDYMCLNSPYWLSRGLLFPFYGTQNYEWSSLWEADSIITNWFAVGFEKWYIGIHWHHRPCELFVEYNFLYYILYIPIF